MCISWIERHPFLYKLVLLCTNFILEQKSEVFAYFRIVCCTSLRFIVRKLGIKALLAWLLY